MLIFAIDDERSALRLLHGAIAEAAPQAQIMDFSLGSEAASAIEEGGLRPDVVFSDIRMPQLDGMALAMRIRRASPTTRVVFVTAYSEYAVSAFRLHASGYVMKPVTAQEVLEELEYRPVALPLIPDGLWVRCFGNFEVFWNGKPLAFARRQTKELLAYLIDREGAMCSAEEIISVLWENEMDVRAAKNRLRQLISDLKNALSGIGKEDVLARRSGQLSVVPDRMPCDFYRMLGGDMQWVNAWNGEYMTQYSWAEMTEGRLHFRGY